MLFFLFLSCPRVKKSFQTTLIEGDMHSLCETTTSIFQVKYFELIKTTTYRNCVFKMQQAHVTTLPPNPEKKKGSRTTLYIDRIPEGMDENMLYNDFTSFGRVVATKVYLHRRRRANGSRKISGFVEFESSDAAQNAMNSLNEDGHYRETKMQVSWAVRSLSESLTREAHDSPVKESVSPPRGKVFQGEANAPLVKEEVKHPVMREAQLWYRQIQEFYMQQMNQQQILQQNAMYAPIAYAIPPAVIHVHHHHQDYMQYYPHTPIM